MKDLENSTIDIEALRILKHKFVNLELLRSLIILNDNKDLVKAKRKTKFTGILSCLLKFCQVFSALQF